MLAGSSVPGADFDTVIGTVIARNLDALVVRGGTVVRTDGSVVYARGDIEVTLGSGTDVTKDGGSTLPLNIDDDFRRPAHPGFRRMRPHPISTRPSTRRAAACACTART